MSRKHLSHVVAGALAAVLIATSAPAAEKKYDPGATDTQIKIGNIAPYSGPASAYGISGRTAAAYFRMVNDEGGINGRKIEFVSYDDGFSPPKAVEQVRKLVESDEVLFIYQSVGTPSNAAIQKFLNARKVPQLFVASNATRWGNPERFPWTIGWQPNFQSEGRAYAKYILKNYPNSKIAVLWQNDDGGKDQLKGLRDGLGSRASMIVADASFELSEPTIDAHLARLKSSGADIFVAWSTPKASAQAIRKLAELDWKPTFFLGSISSSVASVLRPAGLENAKGIISNAYLKDPVDPTWRNDPEIRSWNAFMDKYLPDGDKADRVTVYGYAVAATLVEILKRCNDDLTRENVMRQATTIKDLTVPMLLPGIKINTSPTDYFPVEQMQLIRFDGQRWQPLDELVDAEVGSSNTN
ncbi:ABC transporter substrate-binding protein [Rhodopseudomonas sp. P2A-2r]|uniref:ABC transporter substrate-binding protein n=1 Tax=Rhodopseudomonas sp. P2A-2r TaxID=2991972 RepID=UPI00223453B8|nr:ABC transporter substrate-binding protein [Rhodopseudomonas sp. P2A-2r]UZE47873.1 ABC transporter substrate-binding protein [Rhodopseudomonas sp. P2A-2r]